MKHTSIDAVPLVPSNPAQRIPRQFTSWKLWLLALFASLFAITLAICTPACRRWQAIEYLDRERIRYQKSSDFRTLRKWIGDASQGFVRVSSISRIDPSEQDVLVLAEFNELRQLDYSSRTLRSTSAREVEALTSLRNLQTLKLTGLRMSDEEIAGWISSCPDLTSINLVNTGASVETLRVLSGRPSIVHLIIQNDADRNASSDDSQTLARLQFVERGSFATKWIHLEGVPATDEFLADWIASCPQLIHVELIEAGTDIRTLQAVSQLPQVTKLWLQGETLTDDDFAVMDSMPQLEHLSLGGKSITGEGIKHFSGSPGLRILGMSGTSLSDEGFTRIACMQNLEQLSICDCRDVRPAGIAALANMPNLDTVAFTPEMITPEIIESLHRLPALKYVGIVGWPLDETMISAIEEHWILECH